MREIKIEAKAHLTHRDTCQCSMCQDDIEGGEPLSTADLALYLQAVADIISVQEAPESAPAALAALLSTRVLLGQVRTLESFLEGALLGMMDEKSQVIGGMQVTKKRSSNKTTWDHDGLISAVRQQALENRKVSAEGEVENPLDSFLRMFKETASVSYWRVKALQAHSIDVSDYRNVEWGIERIVVEPVVGDGEQSDGGETTAPAAGDSSES